MPGRVWAALILGAVAATAAGAAEIVDLSSLVRGGHVHVSFRVEGAFNEEIERAIETGLQVTFRYNVELKRVRDVWPDALIAERRVSTMVTYDNLTKRYSLTRAIDGEIDQTAVVADAEAMRRFMTSVESLSIFDVSQIEPNEEYDVRVKGVMRDRNLLLFIPWDVSTGWKDTHFTYLP
jgi:hypothetical protein